MGFHLLFHSVFALLVVLLLIHIQFFATLNRSPPGSSAPAILQARVLEWVAMPSSLSTCIAIFFLVDRSAQYIFCAPGLFSHV